MNDSWSKSARSIKYSPNWRALQDFEWHNAILFSKQQLSKLQWISKTFGKEFESIEINNISKFHQNWWTINRDHTKFKFSSKVGLGFFWLMLRVGPFHPQQHMAEKHQKITAQSILGKTNVERVAISVPQNLALPIFYLCCPLLQ